MSNDKKETKPSTPQEPAPQEPDIYEPVTLVPIENMEKVKTQRTLEIV